MREDGESEPELQLEAPVRAEPEGTSEQSEPLDVTKESGPAPRGQAMRDHLLSRAAEARRGTAPSPQPVADPLQDELDSIAPSGRPPSAPMRNRNRPTLSPTLVAVFGTLLGLATVASLIAVLIQLDPRHNPPPPETSEPEASEPTAPKFEPPPAVERRRKKVPGPWRVADAKGDPGARVVEGRIGREPFLKVVQAKGIKKAEAYRVLTAFKGVKDLDKCAPKDRFVARIDRASSRVTAFEYIVSKENVLQAKEGADGLLKAKKLDLAVKQERFAGAFMVEDGDFEASAKRGGFEKGIRRALTKALDGFTSVSMMKRGDRLRVVAQEVTVLGEFARYAGIEAVEYLPVDPTDDPLRIYWFRGSSSKGYYNQKGQSLNEGGWRKPIKGAPITSRYNPKRMHPVLKKVMPHNGTDFGAPSGTPIHASSFGTIKFMGYSGASGNLVLIDHAGDIQTGYAHCSRFESGLKVGDRVKRYQTIAYVGSTGRSTGPHLHFSAKKNGKFIDAESLNLDGMRVLPRSERARFDEHREKYDATLDAIALPKPLPVDTTPAPAEDDPDDAEDESEDEEPAVAAVNAPPAAEPPTNPGAAEQPSAPAEPAKPGTASAVFLTDEELLKMQPLDDDGEVEE